MNAEAKIDAGLFSSSTLPAWLRRLGKSAKSSRFERRLFHQNLNHVPLAAAWRPQAQTLREHSRGSMRRGGRQSIVGAALFLIFGSGSALAATITVSPTCTLANAIKAANTDTAANGCVAGSAADTIVLPANSTQGLSVTNGAVATVGLSVTSEITIQGNSAIILRPAALADEFRIFTVEATGKLTLAQVTVSGGKLPAGFNGGGIENSGSLTLISSTISGNSGTQGAGVWNGGTLLISSSTIARNTGVEGVDGGGVFNGGTAVLLNSTISSNTAGLGGGFANTSGGTATLTHTTITLNSAPVGGGVLNQGTLNLARNLISGNKSPVGPEVNNTEGVGTVGVNNFNLFGFNNVSGVVGFTPGPTNVVPVVGVTTAEILNPTLASNGGTTQTHALVAGSPALDVITVNCPPLAADQRDIARPQGAGCDIGSFELTATGPGTCPPAPVAP